MSNTLPAFGRFETMVYAMGRAILCSWSVAFNSYLDCTTGLIQSLRKWVSRAAHAAENVKDHIARKSVELRSRAPLSATFSRISLCNAVWLLQVDWGWHHRRLSRIHCSCYGGRIIGPV